jgi:hypothetical protein
MLDTAVTDWELVVQKGGDLYPLQSRSLALLRTRPLKEAGQDLSASQVDSLRRGGRQAAPFADRPAFLARG